MNTSMHGYETKRFPLTAAQGRVLYHLERLFRSTGHGAREYRTFLADIEDMGLQAGAVAAWDDATCVRVLALMEYHARPMRRVRPHLTGRADFMPGGRFYERAPA